MPCYINVWKIIRVVKVRQVAICGYLKGSIAQQSVVEACIDSSKTFRERCIRLRHEEDSWYRELYGLRLEVCCVASDAFRDACQYRLNTPWL